MEIKRFIFKRLASEIDMPFISILIGPRQALCPGLFLRPHLLQVEILLKLGERPANLVRLAAEVGYGIGDGVMVFEAKERSQFLLIQFLHSHAHVMGKNKVEEYLQLAIKVLRDDHTGSHRAFLTGERR